jgi:hypothetical protein
VIGDDRQVAVPAPVGHLVNADARQPVQAAGIEALSDHAIDDPPDGVPRHPHQPGDRVLGHLLREEGDHVLEVAREAAARARPRDRLDPDAAVRALHTPQRADHVATLGAEIQVPPARAHGVVRRSAQLPAARADAPAPPQRDRHHDPLDVKPDRPHRGTRKPEQPIECRADAHAALLCEALTFDSQQPYRAG